MKVVEMDPNTTLSRQLASTDESPVILINRFHVPGSADREFLAHWQEDAHYMLTHGCLSGQLHQGTEGSGSYINVAVWENAQTLARAFTSAEFQQLVNRYPDTCTVSPHVFRRIAVPGVCIA